MGASSATTKLGLPIFGDNDKPTWRGDFNDAMHTLDTDATNFKDKVGSIALGVKTDSFRLASGLTDQSANLTAWLADNTLSGIRRLITDGPAHVANEVTVPTGINLDARKSTLIQDTANLAILNMAGGSRVLGGNFIGKSTDFVARTGSFTPTAIGIKIVGGAVPHTFIEGSILTGFGHAGIYAINAPYVMIDGVEVYGPNGVSGVVVPAADGGSFGIYFGLTCPDAVVNNSRVENASIGLITSRDSARFTLAGARLRNIPGQHGAYLQNGTNLVVQNVVGDAINLNLVKLQIQAVNAADQLAPRFNGISGKDIGDTVLSINNIDADLTAGYKILAPAASNINGHNVLRVLYAGSVVGGSFSNIGGYNVTGDGITVLDAQDTVVENFALHNVSKAGVRVTTATGSLTRGLTVKSGRIYNPGNANVAGSRQGVVVTCSSSVNDGKNITIDDVHAYADNNLMDYAVQVTSAEMATFRLRNCTAIGAITRPFAVPAGTLDIKEWINNDGGNKQTLNYPMNRPVRTGSVGDNTLYACNVQPVSGLFVAGDVIHNVAPAAAGTPGWVATVTGGASSGTWAATTAYAVGTWIKTSGGRILACTVAGISGAAEPVPVTINTTIVDGTVSWVYMATSPATFKARANIAA